MLVRAKIREWLWRYGPAEIISIPATLLPALLVRGATGSDAAAAVAGTWGGNVAYFGTILLRDVWMSQRRLAARSQPYGLRSFGANLRALVVEFGAAEVVDTFFARPALMYWMPRWLGHYSAGIIVAKFAADVTFYLPAIFFYEWSKGRYRDKQ